MINYNEIDDDDAIPCIGQHRGIGLHDQQSVARLEFVKRNIDAVFALNGVPALTAFVKDAANAPEARIFAGQKLKAIFQTAVNAREARPDGINLAKIHAQICHLDSVEWRSPTHFTSDLDRAPGAVRRDAPIGQEDK
jgi:hypothetical protein